MYICWAARSGAYCQFAALSVLVFTLKIFVCVFQVIQVLPALGGMAGMVSEALKGRQAFLVCPVPQALLALLVSASQPPAPCRLVSEPLAKGQSSERLSAAWLSA